MDELNMLRKEVAICRQVVTAMAEAREYREQITAQQMAQKDAEIEHLKQRLAALEVQAKAVDNGVPAHLS